MMAWLANHSIVFYAIVVLLTAAAMVIAYQTIDPAPEDRIVITAGREDGAYYQYAREYARRLANSGVTVEVRASNGSVENLERLRDHTADVDLAFVQGGIARAEDGQTLASLASIYYEPIWFFYRHPDGATADTLRDMADYRLAVDREGSGTRALVSRLLEENGVDITRGDLLPLGGLDAVDALRDGRVDGAFFIASPDSPTLQSLFQAPDVRLMSFDRAEAYAMRYDFLSHVRLPRGVIDLSRDIPHHDIEMVATTANLVARRDLHPALVDLILSAATAVHGDEGMFEARGEFPSPAHVDVPINPEAERYLSHGPGFLDRYLPFWAATLVDRFKVMLIPLVVVFLPLFKLVPTLVVWNLRSRVFRWYGELARVEKQIQAGTARDRQQAAERLDEIDATLRTVKVPGAFNQNLYILREHVDLLRSRIRRDSRQQAETANGKED